MVKNDDKLDGELIHLPSNHCLSVVSQLDKGDYPKDSYVVFCPNKLRTFLVFGT